MNLRQLADEWGLELTATRNALQQSGAADLCGRRGLAWVIPAEAVRRAEEWRAANARKQPERTANVVSQVAEMLGRNLALMAQTVQVELIHRRVTQEAADEWLARYERAVGLLMATLRNLPSAPLSEDYMAAVRRQAETMNADQWLESYRRGMLEVSMSLEVSEDQRAAAAAFLHLDEAEQRKAAEAERAEILSGAEPTE